MKKIIIVALLAMLLVGCSTNVKGDGLQDISASNNVDVQAGTIMENAEGNNYNQVNIDTSKFDTSRFDNQYIISNKSVTLKDGTIIFIENQDYISNDSVKTQAKIYEYKENGENTLLYSFSEVAILSMYVDNEDNIYCSVGYGNYDLENEYAFAKIVDGELKTLIEGAIKVIYASESFFNYIIDSDFGDGSIYRYNTQTNVSEKIKSAYTEFSNESEESTGNSIYYYTYENIVNPDEITTFEFDEHPIVISSEDNRYQLICGESVDLCYLLDKYNNQVTYVTIDKQALENSTNEQRVFDIRDVEAFTIIDQIMYIFYNEGEGRTGIYNCSIDGMNLAKIGETEFALDSLQDIVVNNGDAYLLFNQEIEVGNRWQLYKFDFTRNILTLITEGVIENELININISIIGNTLNVYNISYEYFGDTEETIQTNESLFNASIEP